MKNINVLTSLLFLATFLNVTSADAAPQKGVELPATSIYQVLDTRCGLINSKLKPGTILKSGLFYTFAKRLAALRQALETANENEAVKINRQINKFKRLNKEALPVCVALANNTAIPGATIADSSTTLQSLEDQAVGATHLVYCPANLGLKTIWGTNVYTSDSVICIAAVHAGLISLDAGGNVIIRAKEGLASYLSTNQNGIYSNSWGSWPLSFVFIDLNTALELL